MDLDLLYALLAAGAASPYAAQAAFSWVQRSNRGKSSLTLSRLNSAQ